MTGARFESPEQAAAFSGLFKDCDATAAFVYDDQFHAVRVVLWRGNGEVFRGMITSAGTVREDLTVAA